MTLEFDKVEDNGGSHISNYNLYIDIGTEASPDYRNVTTYDRRSLKWTVNQADETYIVAALQTSLVSG